MLYMLGETHIYARCAGRKRLTSVLQYCRLDAGHPSVAAPRAPCLPLAAMRRWAAAAGLALSLVAPTAAVGPTYLADDVVPPEVLGHAHTPCRLKVRPRPSGLGDAGPRGRRARQEPSVCTPHPTPPKPPSAESLAPHSQGAVVHYLSNGPALSFGSSERGAYLRVAGPSRGKRLATSPTAVAVQSEAQTPSLAPGMPRRRNQFCGRDGGGARCLSRLAARAHARL